MAQKEQCNKCECYKSGICTRDWNAVVFDESPCEMAQKSSQGIKASVSDTTEYSTMPNRRIRKRGSSVTRSNVISSTEEEKNQKSTKGHCGDVQSVYVGEKTFRSLTILWYFLSVSVIAAISIGGWMGWGYYRNLQKKELALEVCSSLYPLRDNKLISYLHLSDMGLEGDQVLFKLMFADNQMNNPLFNALGHGDNLNDSVSNSLKLNYFLSMMTVVPEKWDAACHLLDSAGLDIQIVYPQVGDSCFIPHTSLKSMTTGSLLFQKGEELFLEYKKADVVRYAKHHFKSDRFFSVDSVSLTSDFVTLHLNYDDTHSLGDVFMDEEHIAPHFTDPVGEMGSIADNMLTICSLTNSGMAIEYFGRKSHKVKRWEWDANRTQAFLADYPGYIPYSGRQMNQIRSVLVK